MSHQRRRPPLLVSRKSQVHGSIAHSLTLTSLSELSRFAADCTIGHRMLSSESSSSAHRHLTPFLFATISKWSSAPTNSLFSVESCDADGVRPYAIPEKMRNRASRRNFERSRTTFAFLDLLDARA